MRLPRPMICLNVVTDPIGFMNTMLRTEGAFTPVESRSTVVTTTGSLDDASWNCSSVACASRSSLTMRAAYRFLPVSAPSSRCISLRTSSACSIVTQKIIVLSRAPYMRSTPARCSHMTRVRSGTTNARSNSAIVYTSRAEVPSGTISSAPRSTSSLITIPSSTLVLIWITLYVARYPSSIPRPSEYSKTGRGCPSSPAFSEAKNAYVSIESSCFGVAVMPR